MFEANDEMMTKIFLKGCEQMSYHYQITSIAPFQSQRNHLWFSQNLGTEGPLTTMKTKRN
jgi:hypothetical protein